MSSYSFIGVSQSLPTTAYIKMVDIWMMFCILYPFFIVLLYTIIEVFTNKENKVKSKAGDWLDNRDEVYRKVQQVVIMILDWGLPLMFNTFIIIYWAFGMVNYIWPDVEQVC